LLVNGFHVEALDDHGGPPLRLFDIVGPFFKVVEFVMFLNHLSLISQRGLNEVLIRGSGTHERKHLMFLYSGLFLALREMLFINDVPLHAGGKRW